MRSRLLKYKRKERKKMCRWQRTDRSKRRTIGEESRSPKPKRDKHYYRFQSLNFRVRRPKFSDNHDFSTKFGLLYLWCTWTSLIEILFRQIFLNFYFWHLEFQTISSNRLGWKTGRFYRKFRTFCNLTKHGFSKKISDFLFRPNIGFQKFWNLAETKFKHTTVKRFRAGCIKIG